MIVTTRSQRWLLKISLCCLLLGIGSAYLDKSIGFYGYIALAGFLILPLLYRFYKDSTQKNERLFHLFSFGAITGVILFSCFMMFGWAQHWIWKQKGTTVHTSNFRTLVPRTEVFVPRTAQERPPAAVKEPVITYVSPPHEAQHGVVKPKKNRAKRSVKKAKGEQNVGDHKKGQRQTFSPTRSVRPVSTPDFILKSEYTQQK